MTDQARALSEEHEKLRRELCSIAADHPWDDPVTTLGRLVADADAALARHGTPQGLVERTGYLILLHAMSWYVEARLPDQDALIVAYERVLKGFQQTFPAQPVCTCPDDDWHPSKPEPETAADLGVQLLTDDGRAFCIEEEELEEEELAAYDCELFLSDLAVTAAYQLPVPTTR